LVSEDLGVISPGKLDNVSLTSGDWVICHQSSHTLGTSSSWIVKLELLFSMSYKCYGPARSCCLSQAVLLPLTGQDVILINMQAWLSAIGFPMSSSPWSSMSFLNSNLGFFLTFLRKTS
jgi:hypothetical protein